MRLPRIFSRRPETSAAVPAIPPETVSSEAIVERTATMLADRLQGDLERALTPAALTPMSPLSGVEHAQYGAYRWDDPWRYYTPQSPSRRPNAILSVITLRQIAENYDILRSCINHLKREVTSVPIEIVAIDPKDESDQTKQDIIDATRWFDTEGGGLGGHGKRRAQFESAVIEDLCVIGASATYYHPARSGKPYECVTIDASTIRPRVDAYGWPGPTDKVYEQWILGLRVAWFTRDELRYDGVFPTTNSPYFKSPIEWLVGTVNGALQADNWNLSWLTHGTTPSDSYAMPQDWTADQIKDFFNFMTTMNKGQTKERVQAKLFPSGTQKVNEGSRKDNDFQEYMLWLMRRTCSIMGVSPASIGFAGEQYKVSQEDSMDSTTAFGAGVLLEHRVALYNDLLLRLGYENLKCVNVNATEESAAERATRNSTSTGTATKTINEARAEDGLDPIEGGDELMISNTLVPFRTAIETAETNLDNLKNPPEDPSLAGGEPVEQVARTWGPEAEAAAQEALREKNEGADHAERIEHHTKLAKNYQGQANTARVSAEFRSKMDPKAKVTNRKWDGQKTNAQLVKQSLADHKRLSSLAEHHSAVAEAHKKLAEESESRAEGQDEAQDRILSKTIPALRLWEKKALARVKRGQSVVCSFEHEDIARVVSDWMELSLQAVSLEQLPKEEVLQRVKDRFAKCRELTEGLVDFSRGVSPAQR